MDQNHQICHCIQQRGCHKTQGPESRSHLHSHSDLHSHILVIGFERIQCRSPLSVFCGPNQSLTCRQQRLSQPVLYAHLRFFQYNELVVFTRCLTSNPSLGRHVRSLYFPCDDVSMGFHILERLINLMPELQQLRGIDDEPSRTEMAVETIKWAVFESFARLAGHSLVVLRTVAIAAPYNPKSPAIFENFGRLRHLDWYSDTVFSQEPDKVSPRCLASLEQLDVFQCHETFLSALTHMRYIYLDHVLIPHGSNASYASLPSLQRLSLHGNHTLKSWHLFLQTHGGKIRHLETSDFSKGILDVCPAITVLVLATVHLLYNSQSLRVY